MRFLFVFLSVSLGLFSTIACSRSSDVATGDSGQYKQETSTNRGTLNVSRSGSILTVTQTEYVSCAETSNEGELRLNFPGSKSDLYFRFSGIHLVSGTFDLSRPSAAVYFTGSYEGSLLTWSPELRECTLKLARNGNQLSANFDCLRNRVVTSNVSETLRVVLNAACLVKNK